MFLNFSHLDFQNSSLQFHLLPEFYRYRDAVRSHHPLLPRDSADPVQEKGYSLRYHRDRGSTGAFSGGKRLVKNRRTLVKQL